MTLSQSFVIAHFRIKTRRNAWTCQVKAKPWRERTVPFSSRCPQCPALGVAFSEWVWTHENRNGIRNGLTNGYRKQGKNRNIEGGKAAAVGVRECAAPPAGGAVEGPQAASTPWRALQPSPAPADTRRRSAAPRRDAGDSGRRGRCTWSTLGLLLLPLAAASCLTAWRRWTCPYGTVPQTCPWGPAAGQYPGGARRRHWARHGHPSTPRSLPGAALPPPPSAAFLGPSHARTSTPSPTPPSPTPDPLRCLPLAGAPRGRPATRGKRLLGASGGRRRGGGGDSGAARKRLAARSFSSGGHASAFQPRCPLHQVVPAAPGPRRVGPPARVRARSPASRKGMRRAQPQRGRPRPADVRVRWRLVLLWIPRAAESLEGGGTARQASPFPQARDRIRCFQVSRLGRRRGCVFRDLGLGRNAHQVDGFPVVDERFLAALGTLLLTACS